MTKHYSMTVSSLPMILLTLTWTEANRIIAALGEDDELSIRLKESLNPKADND